MQNNFTLRATHFSQGKHAKMLTVPVDADAAHVLTCLHLPTPRAVLVLNGGASNLDADVSQKLVRHFDALAEFVISQNITVVTGGTNSGVFKIFGEALDKGGGATAPCIGVTIDVPERLEPNHTHFVLVQAKEWGMETEMMYKIVSGLSKRLQSIAIFAGGGIHALKEMQWNVAQHRKMVFIAGSKGYPDRILRSINLNDGRDFPVDVIRQSNLLLPFQIESESSLLVKTISRQILRQ